ncbi:MAG: TetR/AcrR family transcriptional regulator [Clostridiales bacterium]|nr:TetR/AcrR family transcriptional regulator [Clostridiales bacterium]
MDLREKKTLKNIRNAFLELRAKKPLERITIKELAGLAEISKATFYLHYKDIYDLSETLQNELIQNILHGITHPACLVTNIDGFIEELFYAFYAQQSLIDILFSGSQASVLPICIEEKLSDYIHQLIPETAQDAKFNIRLTYQIQGGYYAYQKYYRDYGIEMVIDVISRLSDSVL